MVHMDMNNNNSDDDFEDFEDADFSDMNNIDDNAFEDFDETQKGSLKDIWQNNPVIKLGVIGVGLIVVIIAIILFSGGEDDVESKVANGTDRKELLGKKEVSPEYKNRIDEVNEFGGRVAEVTGDSFMPVSTETFQKPEDFEKKQEELEIDDPLRSWRTEKNEKIEETPKPEPQKIEPVTPVVQQQQLPPAVPNQQMASNLSNGLLAQMRQILEGQNIAPIRTVRVSDKYYLANERRTLAEKGIGVNNNSGNNDGSNGNSGSNKVEPAKSFLPAGEVYYAQTLTEANTDAPGPILAQILQGPLKGSRVLGGFSEAEEYLTITFDKVIYKDRTIGIDAIALDADTTLPGVVTDIDHRYFKRVVLPAAAAFVEGFGSAVADSGSTTVSVSGDTVATSELAKDTREELLNGTQEGATVISEFLQEEADRTKVMIKVAAGTPIGILFLEEITQDQANGYAEPNNQAAPTPTPTPTPTNAQQ